MSFYQTLIRPILFRFDPETAHHAAIALGGFCRVPLVASVARAIFHFDDSRLRLKRFGLNFSSPICFAAGMDKNGCAIELLTSFGCAAMEVGVISAKPQRGNDRPRIHRFPSAKAIVNRMGNPNIGADAAVFNMARARRQSWLPPLGLNIGKTTETPIDQALDDYKYTFQKLYQFFDYFVLNVSCPNVADYSKLQERERLQELFAGLQAVNVGAKPILVKLAPDLNEKQIDEALETALENGIQGVIATNTTTSRVECPEAAAYQGGLSGAPLFARSLHTVKYLAARLQGKMPIVAVGGIFTADDVITMLRAGASLTELYTALVYEGPGLVKKMKQDLVARMERDGVQSIESYIGAAG